MIAGKRLFVKPAPFAGTDHFSERSERFLSSGKDLDGPSSRPRLPSVLSWHLIHVENLLFAKELPQQEHTPCPRAGYLTY